MTAVAAGALRQRGGVDRDGMHADVDDAPVGQQQPVVAPPRREPGEQRRPREVVAEAHRLEADVRRAEQPVDDLLVPRQPRPHLGRRERHVQEEGDPRVVVARPEHPRDEHQVVVVHPQQRLVVGQGVRLLREPLVRRRDRRASCGGRARSARPGRAAAATASGSTCRGRSARPRRARDARRAGRPAGPTVPAARRGRRPSRARCRACWRPARAPAPPPARRSPAPRDRPRRASAAAGWTPRRRARPRSRSPRPAASPMAGRGQSPEE